MFNLDTYPVLYQGKKVPRAVTVKFVTQKKLTQVSAVIEDFSHPYRDKDEDEEDKYDLWFKIVIFNRKGREVGKWQYGHSYPNLITCHRGLLMFEAIPRISKSLTGEVSEAAAGSTPSKRIIRLLGQRRYEEIMRDVPENLVAALQLLHEKGVCFPKASIENELRLGNLSYSPELQELGLSSPEELRRLDETVEPYLQYFSDYEIDHHRYENLYRDAVLKLIERGVNEPLHVVGVALHICESSRVESALEIMDIPSMMRPEDRERNIASFLKEQFPDNGKSVDDYAKGLNSALNSL